MYMDDKPKYIILYGNGGNGKSHLIKELSDYYSFIYSNAKNKPIENENYVVILEYDDIQELENIAKNRTPTKYILQLNTLEELSYFEGCLWPVIVINMNALKPGLTI
jgi:hypothetical protein